LEVLWTWAPRESEQQSLGLVKRYGVGPASSSFYPSGLTPGRSAWPRRI